LHRAVAYLTIEPANWTMARTLLVGTRKI